MHSEEESLQCTIVTAEGVVCGATFGSKKRLRVHIASIHNQEFK
jgi:hypothetical protein